MTTTTSVADLDQATTSTILCSRLAPAIGDAVRVAAELRDHPQLRILYPALLRELHGTVRASVPLLKTAEHEAVRLASDGDPVAAELVGYYHHHIAEELHHDDWLLDDCTALGGNPADILTQPPSAAVAAMVGPLYYWILHFHPVALLGYLAVTEGAPPTVELIDELQRRTGYPTDAFRALRHHAAVDPHHSDDLWDLIDSLRLTAAQLTVVDRAAHHTVTAQNDLIRQLLETVAS